MFRFCIRIRTLLLTVAVLCLFISWYVQLAERQRRAVAWVKEMGGSVLYRDEIDPFAEPFFGGWPARLNSQSSSWWRNLSSFLGIDYVSPVVGVQLRNKSTGSLEKLESLPKLEYLDLSGTNASKLEHLATLKRLWWLSLANTQVSDLGAIANLTNVRTLFVDGSAISDLNALSKLEKLEFLFLDNTKVSNLSPIFNLEHLLFLSCSDLDLTDSQMTQLSQNLPKCEVWEKEEE